MVNETGSVFVRYVEEEVSFPMFSEVSRWVKPFLMRVLENVTSELDGQERDFVKVVASIGNAVYHSNFSESSPNPNLHLERLSSFPTEARGACVDVLLSLDRKDDLWGYSRNATRNYLQSLA
jgi:hypothetical protein